MVVDTSKAKKVPVCCGMQSGNEGWFVKKSENREREADGAETLSSG